ncbi:MAG: preprotein translocase subunit SecG [Pyrinomonadaceae bacterium]
MSCVVLIGSVLLQPGKTDAGALFTSNVSSTAFSPRGTASVLSKFTIGAAALFMLSALMISMPALSGNVSVLQGSSEEAPAAAPAETTPAPDAPPTTDANVVPGQTQQIVIPADSNSNAAVLNVPATPVNSAPANAAPANK